VRDRHVTGRAAHVEADRVTARRPRRSHGAAGRAG
jgi:hypothetical protein